MMKRVNLFDDEGLCIGSIYEVSEKGMVVDINDVYSLMWIKNAKAIDFEFLSLFINGHKTIEIGVELDTNPERNYTLRIKDKVLSVLDDRGETVFSDRCVEAHIEDDSESDMGL